MDKGELMLDLAGLPGDTELVVQVRTWADNGQGYASSYLNLAGVEVDMEEETVFLIVDTN